jgi:hypothetical protein
LFSAGIESWTTVRLNHDLNMIEPPLSVVGVHLNNNVEHVTERTAIDNERTMPAIRQDGNRVYRR